MKCPIEYQGRKNMSSGPWDLICPPVEMLASDVSTAINTFPGKKIPAPGLTFLGLQQCIYKIRDLNQIDFNAEVEVFIMGR